MPVKVFVKALDLILRENKKRFIEELRRYKLISEKCDDLILERGIKKWAEKFREDYRFSQYIDTIGMSNLLLASTFFDVKAEFVSHIDLPIEKILNDEDAFELWKKYITTVGESSGYHIPIENNIGKLFAFLQKIAKPEVKKDAIFAVEYYISNEHGLLFWDILEDLLAEELEKMKTFGVKREIIETFVELALWAKEIAKEKYPPMDKETLVEALKMLEEIVAKNKTHC